MLDSEAKENDEDLLGEDSEGLGEIAGDVAATQAFDSKAPVTIEALQQQLNEANDRVLRAQAELENFRKRSRRDIDDQRQYASLPLVSDLLPAFDNLDRAVEAAEQNENATGLLEGVKMVALQIQSILEQHHCRRLAASSGTFDPYFHQAIAQEPSEDVPAGNIMRQVQVGYQLHDRVIRPAQVMVSSGTPQSPAND